jgi:hypothetical protein
MKKSVMISFGIFLAVYLVSISASAILTPLRVTVGPPFYVNFSSVQTTGVTLEIINNGAETYTITKLSVSNCGSVTPNKDLISGGNETFVIPCTLTEGDVIREDTELTWRKIGSSVDIISKGQIFDVIVSAPDEISESSGDTTEETFERENPDSIQHNITIRQEASVNITQTSSVSGEKESNLNRTMEEIRERIRYRTNLTLSRLRNQSECLEGCRCAEGIISCMTEDGSTLNITTPSGNYIYIYTERNEEGVRTEVEVEIYRVDSNRTRMRARTANGTREVEINVMPDEASEIALQRLRLRECRADRNCSIELKEIEDGEKLAYEIRAERKARILGIFEKKMRVMAHVNAENREIIRVEKPWWAFLATEPEE